MKKTRNFLTSRKLVATLEAMEFQNSFCLKACEALITATNFLANDTTTGLAQVKGQTNCNKQVT
jgi:hypothetical protein